MLLILKMPLLSEMFLILKMRLIFEMLPILAISEPIKRAGYQTFLISNLNHFNDFNDFSNRIRIKNAQPGGHFKTISVAMELSGNFHKPPYDYMPCYMPRYIPRKIHLPPMSYKTEELAKGNHSSGGIQQLERRP